MSRTEVAIYKDSTIVAADIATGAVETDKIKDANVTTAKIADANVTADKLSTDSVITAKIKDKNVTKEKLADDIQLAVTTPYPFTTRGFSMPIWLSCFRNDYDIIST